jgi:hypothetical protein
MRHFSINTLNVSRAFYGACPQKPGPDKSERGFCGHPALLFRRCACQNPGGVGNCVAVGFDAICSLILPEH